jgi:amino acid transporter
MGTKLAYYAGWTYFACHITYIASKGSGSLKALSWFVFRNAETYDSFPTIYVQLATLGVFLIGCFVASRGLNPLKKLLTLAGSCMFVMSILYILMMFAAPLINPGASYVEMDFSLKNLIPNFNIGYFTSLSILVFAVGGCEKISPYVNKVENPSKGFPKGIIAMAIMVVVCAILGTVAMGKMFDPAVINSSEEAFNSYAANGSYWAFQKLGEYYHVGNFFMMIYALCNLISQFAILILSIDAPLRMLLDNPHTKQYIPTGLQKQNKYGVYSNGIKLIVVLSGIIIVAQMAFPGAAAVLQKLNKLNSVCMPMRYLWVFTAYLGLRKAMDKFPAEYRFVQNQVIAKFFGAWCFLVTAVCCIMGMYSTDLYTFAMNVITPIVLTALGVILPQIAKREAKTNV